MVLNKKNANSKVYKPGSVLGFPGMIIHLELLLPKASRDLPGW